MKMNILADFQICFSVPLIFPPKALITSGTTLTLNSDLVSLISNANCL